jgi:hypothetical protein
MTFFAEAVIARPFVIDNTNDNTGSDAVVNPILNGSNDVSRQIISGLLLASEEKNEERPIAEDEFHDDC